MAHRSLRAAFTRTAVALHGLSVKGATPARTFGGAAPRMAASVTKREPLLFTPGPLTTSHTVKQAMLQVVADRRGPRGARHCPLHDVHS